MLPKFERIKKLASQPLVDEKQKKMVEIIMLKYKDPEVEEEAVKRIIKYTDWPFKLIVYDNRINENRKNISKIWNKLIKQSICDYVLILDSDCFVPKIKPCWLTRMMETFEKEKNCYLVLPLVSSTSADFQKAEKAKKYPAYREVKKEDGVWAGQMMLFKKELFEKIGYFDEEFYVYGQDSEFSARMYESPYKLFLREDVLIEHLGSYSLSKAQKEYDFILEREYAHWLFFQKLSKLKHEKK